METQHQTHSHVTYVFPTHHARLEAYVQTSRHLLDVILLSYFKNFLVEIPLELHREATHSMAPLVSVEDCTKKIFLL